MEHIDQGLLEVTPNGKNFKMLVPPEDFGHYLNNAYESFTAELILSHINEGKSFLDIGARYGYYSLIVCQRYPGCHVIAFEPAQPNISILKKNTQLNGFPNVDIRTGTNEGLFNGIQTDCIVRIAAGELDVLMRPDLRGLLDGAYNTEVFLEFNPMAIERSGHSPEKILELVDELGFSIYLIDDERRETYHLSDPQSWKKYLGEGNFNKDYFNLICIKKDRALSLCIFSHSHMLSGAERGLLELVTELIRDYSVLCTVILPDDGPLKGRLESVGSSVLIVHYGWWCDFVTHTEKEVIQSYSQSLTALCGQMDCIRKIDPDLILTNTMVIPWGAIAALALNKPHAWHVREFGQLDHGLQFNKPMEEVANLIKTSNLIITNSNAVKKTLFKDETGNIATIYNYVSIPLNAQDFKGVNYFTRTGATRLIILGSISESKGQKDAVLAMNELVMKSRDVELVIMGMPLQAYLNELQNIVRDNHLEAYVKFFNFENNPYPAVDQADILLVCSRSEAFGRVIIESMLLKKPVIATNSGGVPELVIDGVNGLLYEPGNYRQLAEKIERLIDSPDEADRLVERGYGFAKEKFTEDHYGGALYRRFLGLKNVKNNSSTPLSAYITGLVMQISKASVQKDLLTKDVELKEAEARRAIAENEAEARRAIAENEAEARRVIAQKDKAIIDLDEELHSMKNSLTWRTLMKYQSCVDWLMPRDTRRRKIYDRGLMAVRKVFNTGFQLLFSKSEK